MLQSLVLAVLLVLMLMTVEAVAGQSDAGRSPGLVAASSDDSRMIEGTYAQTRRSTARIHRRIAVPEHGRLRGHSAQVRAGSPRTIVVHRYDRPGSYFLHGARF
jgi:hypothetical protein